MALVPYRGGWDIDRLFNDDDWADWPSLKVMKMPAGPKVDVYEKEGKVIVKAELPGFKSDQISAEIKDNMLVIEAKSEEDKEEDGGKNGYWRKEISRGYMRRVVSLPVEVVSDKAAAEFENGVLKIEVPKAQPQLEEKTRKLEIKAK